MNILTGVVSNHKPPPPNRLHLETCKLIPNVLNKNISGFLFQFLEL